MLVRDLNYTETTIIASTWFIARFVDSSPRLLSVSAYVQDRKIPAAGSPTQVDREAMVEVFR